MKAGHCMPWIVQYMKEHGILPEQAVVFADLGLPENTWVPRRQTGLRIFYDSHCE